ncbi:hypothetical protein I6M49_21760 [Shewanella algae]|uniref:hypothetical protein n=1 Tax=Shewanella algae TaxID=38313 RepID=UPI001AACDE6D|nr:hypothetical protein [Shewanella algae]MBO2656073.1 hypothetical protein [Shewanella algae]
MKNINIAMSLVAVFVASVASTNVMADENTGTVNFTGSVSKITCNIEPEINGGEVNTIQLGVVGADETGDLVSFSLRPTPGSSCDLGDDTTGIKSSSVTWVSSALNSVGLGNQTGAASDAYALLKSAGSSPSDVTRDNPVASFTRADLTGNAGAMPFTIQLKAGKTVGAYAASATYLVAYE